MATFYAHSLKTARIIRLTKLALNTQFFQDGLKLIACTDEVCVIMKRHNSSDACYYTRRQIHYPSQPSSSHS